MKNYNYANEIIKDYDQPEATKNFKRRYPDGVQIEAVDAVKNIDITDTIKAFKERLRNDSVSTEQKPGTPDNSSLPGN